jgi:MFS family permease
VLSDRIDKRRFLVATQSTMLFCALMLGVMVLSGSVSVIWVVALAGASGVALLSTSQPGAPSSPNSWPSDAANAISLNGALNQGAKLAGPAAAGILIDTVGQGWCFILNGSAPWPFSSRCWR